MSKSILKPDVEKLGDIGKVDSVIDRLEELNNSLINSSDKTPVFQKAAFNDVELNSGKMNEITNILNTSDSKSDKNLRI